MIGLAEYLRYPRCAKCAERITGWASEYPTTDYSPDGISLMFVPLGYEVRRYEPCGCVVTREIRSGRLVLNS